MKQSFLLIFFLCIYHSNSLIHSDNAISLRSVDRKLSNRHTHNRIGKNAPILSTSTRTTTATALSSALLPDLIVNNIKSIFAIGFVVGFHEAGHFLAARAQNIKVSSYNIGYGPTLLSYNDTKNEIEYALRALPLGGYVAFPSNIEEMDDDGNIVKENDDPDLLQNRPPIQRLFVISAGVVANVLLTFLLASGTAYSTGLYRPVYGNGIIVSALPNAMDRSNPATIAGLHVNDVIEKINGESIVAGDKQVEYFISKIRDSPNKEIMLEIIRDNAVVKTAIIPSPMSGVNSDKGTIGIGVVSNIREMKINKATNVVEASKIGLEETTRLIEITWNSFTNALSTGFTGSDVGGPISVVKTGAKLAESSSTALVGFIAALSVNLAVVNALPAPVLDGGQFVFVFIELISGKKLPRKLQEGVTLATFLVFLLFSVSTIFKDLAAPPVVPQLINIDRTIISKDR